MDESSDQSAVSTGASLPQHAPRAISRDFADEVTIEDRGGIYICTARDEAEAVEREFSAEADTEEPTPHAVDPTTLYLNEIGYTALLNAEQ